MKPANSDLYQYTYTFSIVVEGDFDNGNSNKNSDTMRMCLTRRFSYEGSPWSLAYEINAFLNEAKDEVSMKRGRQKARTQIVNVTVIDQHKVLLVEEESPIPELAN